MSSSSLLDGLGTAGGTALGGPVGGAIGGGIGSILGGLFGGGPDYNSIFGNITPPSVTDLQNAGQINSSNMAGVTTDPATRAAQMQALQGMQNEYNTGGASVMDRAAQAQMLNASNQQNRSAQEAILQNMAQRGQAGGGTELAARLQMQQNAGQNNAMSGAQLAGDDRMRALQAMQQAGQLGGQVRGEDFSQASQKAQAQDALNAWNAKNRVGAINTNYSDQMQRAQGQAGMAPQQYGRAAGMGGAIGSLAGGAAGYAATTPKQQNQGQTQNYYGSDTGDGSVSAPTPY